MVRKTKTEKLGSCGRKRQDIGQEFDRDSDGNNGRTKTKRILMARHRPSLRGGKQRDKDRINSINGESRFSDTEPKKNTNAKQYDVRVRRKSPRETRKSRNNDEV